MTNPIIQIATGVLLILGLRTRLAAAVTAAFLVSIFFGHLLMDPFDRGESPHAYSMANFLIAIVVLWLHPRGDRFSIDALLARRVRSDAKLLHRRRGAQCSVAPMYYTATAGRGRLAGKTLTGVLPYGGVE